MPLTRLLIVALLLSPLPVFAQSGTTPAPSISVDSPTPHTNAQSTPSDLWPIVPGDGSNEDGSKTAFSIDSLSADSLKMPLPPPAATVDSADSDNACYAIRSYVVARDDKDSDSTHLVHYSTCQPASRYRLRTADARVESPAR
jgi:hypothetical protein